MLTERWCSRRPPNPPQEVVISLMLLESLFGGTLIMGSLLKRMLTLKSPDGPLVPRWSHLQNTCLSQHPTVRPLGSSPHCFLAPFRQPRMVRSTCRQIEKSLLLQNPTLIGCFPVQDFSPSYLIKLNFLAKTLESDIRRAPLLQVNE